MDKERQNSFPTIREVTRGHRAAEYLFPFGMQILSYSHYRTPDPHARGLRSVGVDDVVQDRQYLFQRAHLDLGGIPIPVITSTLGPLPGLLRFLEHPIIWVTGRQSRLIAAPDIQIWVADLTKATLFPPSRCP